MTSTARSRSRLLELPENRLAVQAVTRLARTAKGRPGVVLTTIHGPSGTGKTLLVRTLISRLTARHSGRTARLLAARDFAPHALAELKSADLVIIEDLQYLPAAAAEAFNTLLDERSRRQRATLITAHQEPHRLRRLTRRTLNRIAAGLVVSIEPYSTASRRLILEQHCRLNSIRITTAARDWLAEQPGGTRAMLGTLAELKAAARGPLVSLVTLHAHASRERVGLEQILRRVAETYGVKVQQMLSPSRLRSVLLPRQVAMFLARDLARLSLPQIGERFGRDQSTVQHAVQKVRLAMRSDRELASMIQQLKLELA